ncbi:unnamed protein product [Cuscuta campestris]|uniref:Phosphatidic acid phosphatase type 2/haloperoxidase domain-containing protein n=1 Tax=Cuscuta campestris TaxID=132261 RepID=A0A484NFF1_9ASTE|nr:unnamed protein product [Cuscuta campestris]
MPGLSLRSVLCFENFRWASPAQQRAMQEVQLGSHTVRSHGVAVARTHMHDWLILLLLPVTIAILNAIHPFYRFVGKDMMDDLKYPFKNNTVPFWAVPVYAVLLPIFIFVVVYFRRRDVYDLHHAILGLLFSVLVTGVITDSIKDAVGRPRPDFFWRCFPDGKDVSLLWVFTVIGLIFNALSPFLDRLLIDFHIIRIAVQVYDKLGNVVCHGVENILKDGHKSFPSGHTSWSFAGLGFLSLYLAGKIKAFDSRGHVAKLCLIWVPLTAAALVGISRVDDYRHHWQDVFAGGLLVLSTSSPCPRLGNICIFSGTGGE